MTNKETEIWIIKASGKRELFAKEKLERSLSKAGASKNVVEKIVSKTIAELEDGMTTEQIYAQAFKELRRTKSAVASRYSLRKAVMAMGPSGFPFEQLLGAIFKSKGYKVEVGGILQGACIDHEVDVIAEKGEQHIFVEAKFHNQLGIKTDLKVALYVQARFQDIKKAHEIRAEKEGRKPHFHEGWLVTNTKLTSKAKEYSECRGQVIIGWDYPKHGNLEEMIIESGLHPLTCLTTISDKQKRGLLEQDVVLCRDLKNNLHILKTLGVVDDKIKEVEEEIDSICKQHTRDSSR
ncbi:MAG TPA: ATPase [Candidatus Yonathbacteria bacterium]|nr:ATPase [Candidatus Yonathbacteria bacterium]